MSMTVELEHSAPGKGKEAQRRGGQLLTLTSRLGERRKRPKEYPGEITSFIISFKKLNPPHSTA